jgi:DNA-binding response OmpR family regulator
VRVLIVEDEARIAELVKGALTEAEFVPDTVATVADARAALAVAPYDVIILDLGLPN